MSERFGLKKAFDRSVMETVAPSLRTAYETGGLKGASQAIFEMIHTKPEYLHEKDPDFSEDRARLNREAGLIIANHPGAGDTPAILNTLDREDLKFLVGEQARILHVLPEHMVEVATKDLGKLRPIVRRLIEHIRTGGVVFYYPMGGNTTGKKEDFRSLFGALLKEIPEESMVYAFDINEEDASRIASKGRMSTRASMDTLVPKPLKPLLRRGEPQVLRVNEKYTQAKDWMNAFEESGKTRTGFNSVMREHYDGLFKK